MAELVGPRGIGALESRGRCRAALLFGVAKRLPAHVPGDGRQDPVSVSPDAALPTDKFWLWPAQWATSQPHASWGVSLEGDVMGGKVLALRLSTWHIH